MIMEFMFCLEGVAVGQGDLVSTQHMKGPK